MTCDYIASAERLRVTQVDVCGAPVPGTGNNFVTDCFASVEFSVVTDDQDDLVYRAANGNVCAVKRGCKTLLGYDVNINIHAYSPELLSIMTGNPEVLDSTGATVGFDDCAIPCNRTFAMELWSSLIEPTCTTTGNQRFLYTLIPALSNVYLNDIEIGSDAVSFQITGTTRAGGNWGTGPYNVVRGVGGTPGPMLTPLGASCHRRMQIVDVAPPAAACTPGTVPTP